MRPIQFAVYQFHELNDEHQQRAIQNLKHEVYAQSCERDQYEIQETFSKIQEITGVCADIRSSSQGPYVWSAREIEENYDQSERYLFEQMQKRMQKIDCNTEWAFADWTKELFTEASFDDRRSYAMNVAWILCDLIKRIDNAQLEYLDDDYVAEFLVENDIEFHADGTQYTLKY